MTCSIMQSRPVEEHMKQLQDVFDRQMKGKSPWGQDIGVLARALKGSEKYKSLAARGMAESDIEENFKTTHPVSVFTWEGGKTKKYFIH